MSPILKKHLRIASNKHDIVALKVSDPLEKSIPDVGLIKVVDSETRTEKWIDTSSGQTGETMQNGGTLILEVSEIYLKDAEWTSQN